MARRLDEEQAAMDAGVLNVALALRSELLAQVRGVLILDVLDDRVPAAIVVDEITIAWSINDVQPQPDAILLDDVGDSLDLRRGADRLIRLHATLGVDEVRGEDGVDEGRFAETGLT